MDVTQAAPERPHCIEQEAAPTPAATEPTPVRTNQRELRLLRTITSGSRVIHRKYGEGTVTGIDANVVNINFDTEGMRRISAEFVELSQSHLARAVE